MSGKKRFNTWQGFGHVLLQKLPYLRKLKMLSYDVVIFIFIDFLINNPFFGYRPIYKHKEMKVYYLKIMKKYEIQFFVDTEISMNILKHFECAKIYYLQFYT